MAGCVELRRGAPPCRNASEDAVGAIELVVGDEPPWLVYSATGSMTVLPLALDFEGFLLLHLPGLFPPLAADQPYFDQAVERMRAHPAFVQAQPILRVGLDVAARAADTLGGREEVRVPGMTSGHRVPDTPG